MKTLVIYDSKYGTTEQLARAIAAQLGTTEQATVVAANEASEQDLAGIQLLLVGGPTQAHGLSPAMKAFLRGLPSGALRDVPTAAFDTRLHGPRLLTGSAADSIARQLKQKGARMLVPPESFVVKASEGPLAEGEPARATTWVTAVLVAATEAATVAP